MLYQLKKRVGSPRPWRRFYGYGQQRVRYVVETEDGAELVLWRVRPIEGPARPAPVMLLHGLGANHVGFDFPERSFAEGLARRGYDVWMPDLRGHGESLAGGFNWSLEDYLKQDLPVLIDEILEQAGAEKLIWLGHSMGGILLMAYGLLNPEAPIARGIAVASALDYAQGDSAFAPLLKFRPILERGPAIPFGVFAHLASPLLGRGWEGVEKLNVWSSNIEPELTRRLYARCFHTIPISLLLSLASTFEPGGLTLSSGFRCADHVENLSFPLLLVAGSKDAQVSVEAVRHTKELFGDKAKLVVHGLEYGDGDEYGHWDLFLGKRAEDEVWPGIFEWLEE